MCVEVDLSLGWCDCGPKAARQGADVEIIRCLRAAWANDYAQGGCPMPACAAPSPEMCRGVAACDAAAGRCVVLREGDGAPDPM